MRTLHLKKTIDLIPYVNNSRTHSDDQINQVAASINEFGFTNPVLIDGEGMIIAGHGRVMAAKKLGVDEVPCIVLDDLTEAQKKAYVIADNKLAENGGWNDELLRIEMSDLGDVGFDIDLLGFSDRELSKLFDETCGIKIDDTLEDKVFDSLTVKFQPGDKIEVMNAISEAISAFANAAIWVEDSE